MAGTCQARCRRGPVLAGIGVAAGGAVAARGLAGGVDLAAHARRCAGLFRREGPAEPAGEPEPLEALRRCVGARWRAGLMNLWRDDRALAERLVRRLTATVDFGGGNVLPAWPCALVEGWVSRWPTICSTAGSRRPSDRHVQAWMQLQPDFVQWVADDAGVKGPREQSEIGLVGIANLTGDGAVFRWLDESGADLIPLRVGEAKLIPSPAPVRAIPRPAPTPWRRPGMGGRGNRPAVRGRAGRAGAIGADAVDPDPGGAPRRAGGTAPGGLGAADVAQWCAGIVTARRYGALVQDVATGAWVLELDCRATGADPEPGVKVYFGPVGTPRVVLNIGSDGKAVDQISGQATPVRVAHRPARDGQPASWAAWVTLPANASENGLLRIGLGADRRHRPTIGVAPGDDAVAGRAGPARRSTCRHGTRCGPLITPGADRADAAQPVVQTAVVDETRDRRSPGPKGQQRNMVAGVIEREERDAERTWRRATRPAVRVRRQQPSERELPAEEQQCARDRSRSGRSALRRCCPVGIGATP